MKMYRGLAAHVWVDRLKAVGWPTAAARELAEFLIGDWQEPPEWEKLVSHEYEDKGRRKALKEKRDVE